MKRFTKVQDEYNKLLIEQINRNRKSIKLQAFIDEIKDKDALNIKIYDRLFNLTILNKTVKKEHLEYNFKDASTINIESVTFVTCHVGDL